MRVKDDNRVDGGVSGTRRQLDDIVTCCGALWKCSGELADVQISYNPRLRTTLGRAMLDERRVELNPRLLCAHPGEIVPTLVHELAHLVVHARCGRGKPHGRRWAALMHAAGLTPSRTHNLPAAKKLRRTRRRFIYVHRCVECGMTFPAGKPRHDLYCGTCGPDTPWTILRVVDTPRGRAVAKRMVAAAETSP